MAEHRKAVAVFKHHDNCQLTIASSEQLDFCMQECFDKEEVLHRLMKDANDSELQEKAAAVAAARGIPQHRAIHYLKDLFKLSLPAQHTSCASLCQKMGDMVKQARFVAATALSPSHSLHLWPCSWQTSSSVSTLLQCHCLCLPHERCTCLCVVTCTVHCCGLRRILPLAAVPRHVRN